MGREVDPTRSPTMGDAKRVVFFDNPALLKYSGAALGAWAGSLLIAYAYQRLARRPAPAG